MAKPPSSKMRLCLFPLLAANTRPCSYQWVLPDRYVMAEMAEVCRCDGLDGSGCIDSQILNGRGARRGRWRCRRATS